MKENAFHRFDYSRNFKEVNHDIPEPEIPEPDDGCKSPQDSLLSIVYGRDERTGLPIGDLQYYVSDKANPQIKEFILANLMNDVSAAQNVAAKYNISDDDILALSIQKDETLADYVERLNTSIERDKWLMDEYKKQSKQSVSVSSGDSSVSSE